MVTILDVESYDLLEAFAADITRGVSGSTGVVKPNLVTIAPVSYTRLEVILGLGRTFAEEGFDVVVAEGMPPQVSSYADRVILKTGFENLPFKFLNLEDEPGEVLHLENLLGQPVVEDIVVPRILLDEDVSIINVPKLKTHLMTMYTGAIKNVGMGMVKQYTKARIHAIAGHDFEVLSKALIEVYLALKERIPLTVVDAIESMSGNGPTHGERLDTGKILIGEDTAALDMVLAEMMGMQGAPVPKILRENGLAPDPTQIEFKGTLESFNFQPPSTYRSGLNARIASFLDSENWLSIKLSSFTIDRSWYSLKINKELCEMCDSCVKRCTTGAITHH